MSPYQGTPGAPGAPGTTGPPGKQGELGPPVSLLPPNLGLHLRSGTPCYYVFLTTCLTGGRKSCQSGLAECLSAGLTASCVNIYEPVWRSRCRSLNPPPENWYGPTEEETSSLPFLCQEPLVSLSLEEFSDWFELISVCTSTRVWKIIESWMRSDFPFKDSQSVH